MQTLNLQSVANANLEQSHIGETALSQEAQTAEALSELNAAQLSLVGGGTGVVIF